METYRHEYPFCPRAENDPLIQFARPAWYIRTTQEISRAIENNQAVHWLPEHIQEGRMGDFLRNNVDWALSRERFWGTPLNVWVCERDEAHQLAPASVAEIERLSPGAFDAFRAARQADPGLNEHLIVHKPWIDEVTLPCPSCGATMRGPAQPSKTRPPSANQPKLLKSRLFIVSSMVTVTLVRTVPPYTADARRNLPTGSYVLCKPA